MTASADRMSPASIEVIDVIANVRVVDLETGAATDPSDVWLSGGRIDKIVGSGLIPLPDSVFDAGGRYLVPGLIDSHVHLVMNTRGDPMADYLASTDEEKLQQVVSNARAALLSGITTVRDCGTARHLLKAIVQTTEGLPDVATILHVGAPICSPGGHGHVFGGEVRTRQEVEALVTEQRNAGATWVKVMVSGGGMTPGTKPGRLEFDPVLLCHTVDIATDYGMRVAAHCHATAAMDASIDAGVHMIEHASMLDADEQPAPDRELLRKAVDAGVSVGPTVVVARIVADRLRASGDLVNSNDTNAIKRLDARFTNLAEFFEAGVQVIGGTDAGPKHVGFDLMPVELEIYVEAGMSPLQALRSATCESADALGIGADAGRLRPGAWADAILAEANPAEDISTLRSPVAVLKRGCVVVDHALERTASEPAL
ncbi:amidohydrolase family protein [Rhodococcus sp. NPDC059968]|uniref:amidohydrolase family protein n=1 Tax=Rhodococcus sp. NPDC059968 TaxID=3347017 RepID=UPI0036733BC2